MEASRSFFYSSLQDADPVDPSTSCSLGCFPNDETSNADETDVKQDVEENYFGNYETGEWNADDEQLKACDGTSGFTQFHSTAVCELEECEEKELLEAPSFEDEQPLRFEEVTVKEDNEFRLMCDCVKEWSSLIDLTLEDFKVLGDSFELAENIETSFKAEDFLSFGDQPHQTPTEPPTLQDFPQDDSFEEIKPDLAKLLMDKYPNDHNIELIIENGDSSEPPNNLRPFDSSDFVTSFKVEDFSSSLPQDSPLAISQDFPQDDSYEEIKPDIAKLLIEKYPNDHNIELIIENGDSSEPPINLRPFDSLDFADCLQTSFKVDDFSYFGDQPHQTPTDPPTLQDFPQDDSFEEIKPDLAKLLMDKYPNNHKIELIIENGDSSEPPSNVRPFDSSDFVGERSDEIQPDLSKSLMDKYPNGNKSDLIIDYVDLTELPSSPVSNQRSYDSSDFVGMDEDLPYIYSENAQSPRFHDEYAYSVINRESQMLPEVESAENCWSDGRSRSKKRKQKPLKVLDEDSWDEEENLRNWHRQEVIHAKNLRPRKLKKSRSQSTESLIWLAPKSRRNAVKRRRPLPPKIPLSSTSKTIEPPEELDPGRSSPLMIYPIKVIERLPVPYTQRQMTDGFAGNSPGSSSGEVVDSHNKTPLVLPPKTNMAAKPASLVLKPATLESAIPKPASAKPAVVLVNVKANRSKKNRTYEVKTKPATVVFAQKHSEAVTYAPPYVARKRLRYPKEEYVCHICDYKCTVEAALLNHVNCHVDHSYSKPLASCDICGEDTVPDRKMSHMELTHKIETNGFQCDHCEFTSTQMKKLIQHRRKHTSEKPHHCNLCEYRSTRRDNLHSHARRIHQLPRMEHDTFTQPSIDWKLIAEIAGDFNNNKIIID